MISLSYYLRVVATMWMGSYGAAPTAVEAASGLPPIAGASQETEEGTHALARQRAWIPPDPAITFVAVFFAAATIFFGIVPQPLFDLTHHAGQAISGLFY
jgi:NADH:ubiquinone oxidoreductase subunit 2 (subunit N)